MARRLPSVKFQFRVNKRKYLNENGLQILKGYLLGTPTWPPLHPVQMINRQSINLLLS